MALSHLQPIRSVHVYLVGAGGGENGAGKGKENCCCCEEKCSPHTPCLIPSAKVLAACFDRLQHVLTALIVRCGNDFATSCRVRCCARRILMNAWRVERIVWLLVILTTSVCVFNLTSLSFSLSVHIPLRSSNAATPVSAHGEISYRLSTLKYIYTMRSDTSRALQPVAH